MTKVLRNTLFFLCFALLVVFSFAGCAGGLSKFEDGPASTDIVNGNGSLAVTKGDYMYFVNGYTSYKDVGDTNQDGNILYSALYRIKLENGIPVKVDPKYDDDGNEIFDGSRALKNVDVLARKVVGFEYMGLYIYGDYIYYTSPHNGVNKELEVLSSQIDFFRIKLDRSSGSELLYTTESDGDSVKYSMIQVGSDVFLNVLDGTKLKSTKIDANNKRTTKTVDEHVTSVAFAKYESSRDAVSTFNQDLYYTRSLTEDEQKVHTNGNVLSKFNFATFETQDKVFFDANSTLILKFASTTSLFYEKTCADWSQSSPTNLMFATNNISNNDLHDEQVCNNFTDYMLTQSGNSTLIVNDGSSVILVNYEGIDPQTLYSGSATLISAFGDYVYFLDTTNSALKRINFVQYAKYAKGTAEKPEVETIVSEKVVTTSANCATVYSTDKAGLKLMYLSNAQTNDSVYLHMVDLENGTTDYFVGVLMEKDYDVESES